MGRCNRPLRLFGLMLPGLAVLGSPAMAEIQNAEQARAILVLDASGSMWGQVDGIAKISIAQDVIGDLLLDWNPGTELGVMAYGHRQKRSCEDIETLIPVGPVDPDRVMASIDGLNPKGKTPLTAAVRSAAEQLEYTDQPATVILVSDGKETCDADPCAVAQELEAAGVDFTVHIVGFDLTDEEERMLRCVADNTGGDFLSAHTAPELKEAMTETVKIVAELPSAPEIVGLQVAALDREDGAPLDRGLTFIVDEVVDGKRKRVERTTDPQALFDLWPGHYDVLVEWQQGRSPKFRARHEVEVREGELADVTFVLEAGYFEPSAAIAGDDGSVTKSVDFIIDRVTDGKRLRVTRGPGQEEFALPPGEYDVLAQLRKGKARYRVRETIEIYAGEVTRQNFILSRVR